MRVVRVAIVAPQVDRLVRHLRVLRVAQVGDPDRPAVTDRAVVQARRLQRVGVDDRPEIVLVAPPRRAAGPDVVALLDAAGRVARRQVDEVADLLEVLRVAVRDDVEAAHAVRVADRFAVGVRAARGRRVRVVVAWIERPDDQVALRVQLHVLVLPVTVVLVDLRRQVGVERLRVRRIGDVDRLEAETPGEDEDVLAPDLVELALDDQLGVGDPFDVVEVRRHLRARRRGRRGRRRRYEQQRAKRGRNCPSPSHLPSPGWMDRDGRRYRTPRAAAASSRRSSPQKSTFSTATVTAGRPCYASGGSMSTAWATRGRPSTCHVMSTWSFLR